MTFRFREDVTREEEEKGGFFYFLLVPIRARRVCLAVSKCFQVREKLRRRGKLSKVTFISGRSLSPLFFSSPYKTIVNGAIFLLKGWQNGVCACVDFFSVVSPPLLRQRPGKKEKPPTFTGSKGREAFLRGQTVPIRAVLRIPKDVPRIGIYNTFLLRSNNRLIFRQ